MAALTLHDAAERLAMSPLQVVVHCALHGIPCQAGILDEEVLPALGSVHTVPVEPADGNDNPIWPHFGRLRTGPTPDRLVDLRSGR
jgi:hypothetical protein